MTLACPNRADILINGTFCSTNIVAYICRYGIILAIFQNAKNGRKKTGNLFLISCLGVPFHVAAVIQFTNKPDLICPSVVPFRNYSK